MIPDRHTPCVCCPDVVRTLVEADAALLRMLRVFLLTLPVEQRQGRAWANLQATRREARKRLQAIFRWYEAHTVNQFHRDSPELAQARVPVLEHPEPEARLPW